MLHPSSVIAVEQRPYISAEENQRHILGAGSLEQRETVPGRGSWSTHGWDLKVTIYKDKVTAQKSL